LNLTAPEVTLSGWSRCGECAVEQLKQARRRQKALDAAQVLDRAGFVVPALVGQQRAADRGEYD